MLSVVLFKVYFVLLYITHEVKNNGLKIRKSVHTIICYNQINHIMVQDNMRI